MYSIRANNFHNPFKSFHRLCSRCAKSAYGARLLPVGHETGEEASESHAHQKHHLGKVFQFFPVANQVPLKEKHTSKRIINTNVRLFINNRMMKEEEEKKTKKITSEMIVSPNSVVLNCQEVHAFI